MCKTSNSFGIVFIHGAGLGGFIWNEMEPKIDFATLSVDFPNREIDDMANGKLSFDDYLKVVIDQIENWNKDQMVLATHSIGGCLGLKLLDHFSEKIIAFVGIGSAIPLGGRSFSSCLPFPQRSLLPFFLNIFGTRPPAKNIQSELCSDLKKEQCSKIISRFTPESKSLYTTKISCWSLPKATLYIKLTKDKAFSIDIQEKMARNLKAKEIVELESGHLPMLSQPEELAKILNEFTSKIVTK